MNALGDGVQVEVIQYFPPCSYSYLIAEGHQIELAQFILVKCMLTIPDYFSCISHSWKLF